ncbi:phosphoesterase, MJ0936 family [Aciduliprofundum sp. MAR08-339]|uniref:metallophosphoesterase family protein n=1 Tax=Aciduliprofundum sp. (strain MAR08-339) TaxID=673860 RepID=UPI0002A483B6|nr:phosphoesterase, MJ0936 family [Aciduliprofundum sp. MAR08-339]
MLALISDIHGNLPALKVVLEEIGEADLILCAGDVVGYNPWPNEVIWEIRKRDIQCIRGNHDRAVIYDDYSRFNTYAAMAGAWTRSVLTRVNLEYLYSLKDSMLVEYEGRRIAVHHGAPFDEDYYVYPEDAGESLLRYENPDMLVLGHTHVPFVKKFENGVIINPGSVGQPRDGDPRASFAIVDLDNGVYEIRRVEYPIDEVYNAIIENDLPPILGERLYLGY